MNAESRKIALYRKVKISQARSDTIDFDITFESRLAITVQWLSVLIQLVNFSANKKHFSIISVHQPAQEHHHAGHNNPRHHT